MCSNNGLYPLFAESVCAHMQLLPKTFAGSVASRSFSVDVTGTRDVIAVLARTAHARATWVPFPTSTLRLETLHFLRSRDGFVAKKKENKIAHKADVG